MKVNKPKRKILRGRSYGDNDSNEGGTEGGGGRLVKPCYVRAPLGKSSVKSRKELRKQQRKAKKAQKHQYLLVKCGREDLVLKEAGVGKKKKKKKRKNKKKKKASGDGTSASGVKGEGGKADNDSENSDDDGDEDEKFVRDSLKNKLEKRENIDLAQELKQDGKKMKKEMDEVRRKRLLEENEEEEKTIRQLSKMLKLKSKAKIPASFRTDGLDFILEACEKAGGEKKKKSGDDDSSVEGDGDNSDSEPRKDMDASDSAEEQEGSDFEDEEEDDGMDMDEQDDEGLDAEAMDEEESMDEDNLEDEIFGGDGESDEGIEESDDDRNVEEEVSGSEHEDDAKLNRSKIKKNKSKSAEDQEEKEDDGVWEDIYGRLRSKDGAVIDSKTLEAKSDRPSRSVESTGKYVPPALRGNQSQREKLTKQLKGLLNRLSENNMHSIASQVEELYMTNSRNEMNETLLELLKAALVRPSLMPERVVLEHVMLVAILHANVGTEVGAFFIQSFAQEFKSKYDGWNLNEDDENKLLENLVLVISFIYHFKIVDACLIYDILKFLSDSFKPKDVELILTILRSIGFRLRKDDPAALKELIITLQQKASKQQAGPSGSAKVKFMLEILMAIRNNNMNKIPNYDPSFGEHLLKILKSHLRPGNYVSEMKIGLKDLLNADKVGRWWIVGSAWAGNQSENGGNEPESSSTPMSSEDQLKHAKLMKRARAQGMNTDTRRNVFCVLMTAEDYMDAFEKLNHLGLKNNQDREIMHVTSYCCLQEKKFNPYYGFILSKFCATDRKLMLALQFNLWDRLKDLDSMAVQQRNNLANLLVHLINDKSLPLSTLKVIEYTEMDKVKLKFLKKVLTGILLQKDVDNLQEIFIKPSMSEKLGLFRESLRLFLNHFMLQTSITASDGSTIVSKLSPEEMETLKARVKIAEKCMSLGKSGLIT